MNPSRETILPDASASSYFALRGITADAYASAALPRWLVAELASLASDASVLDFGCGFGQNLRGLERLGFTNLVGADIDADALQHCRSSGLTVVDVSTGLGTLGHLGGSVDCIVTTHVLEHIPKAQVIDILRGLRELLKPGGSIIVAVPNAQAYTGSYWAYEDFTHETLYTYGSLVYILRAAGFAELQLIDRHATAGLATLPRLLRRTFSAIHGWRYRFWKRMLASTTHVASIDVHTYEVKMRARAGA